MPSGIAIFLKERQAFNCQRCLSLGFVRLFLSSRGIQRANALSQPRGWDREPLARHTMTITLHRRCVLVQNRGPISKGKDRLCQSERLCTSVSTLSILNITADGTDNSLRASSTQTTCKHWRKPRDSPK